MIDENPDRAPKSPLRLFCERFMKRHGSEALWDVELLASEFRNFFHVPQIVTLEELKRIAKRRIGILDISPARFDSHPRGMYGKLGDNVMIKYRDKDWHGSQDFTVVHELREIIQDTCREIDPDVPRMSEEELENTSDAFAAAFLMDYHRFKNDMIESGFDSIWLHGAYEKSYIAIVARMTTVASNSPERWPIWTSVYEVDPAIREGYLLCKCFHKSPRYIPKARYQIPNFLFPKRGQLAEIRGGLKVACEQKRSVYVRRIEGLDFWNRYCLCAVIRPVIWFGEIAKLVVLAVPEQLEHLLANQLARIDPLIVKKSSQSL